LNGVGVEEDEEKVSHYTELAAIGGDVTARHNLGVYEHKAGNVDKTIKHFVIAAG
jgi:TPR repeat protein